MQSGIIRSTETSSCLWALQQVPGNGHMMRLRVEVAAKMFNKQGHDPSDGRTENGAESALKQSAV